MFKNHGESHTKSRRSFQRNGKLAAAAIVLASLGLAAAPAYANTTVPTTIKAQGVVHANGSVTVTLSGNWTWPGGQACTGRYGTGWAVGWWGTGTSATPANNLTLTNATQVLSQDQGINGNPVAKGSITATGSLKVPTGNSMSGQNIYLGAHMNGQTIYTPSYCATAQPSGKDLSGTYTASATYASVNDVPANICVVSYDIHGSFAKGAPAKDYDPVGNGDNSLKEKQFGPNINCVSPTFDHHEVPAGGAWGILGFAALGGASLLALELRSRRTSRRQPVTIA
jgi:hypothetical protein